LCLATLLFTLFGCQLFDRGASDQAETSFGGGGISGGPISGSGGFVGGSVAPAAQPLRLAELRSSESGARPVSGGSLAVSADGSAAVAADPDRDCIYVVRPQEVGANKLQLPVGSEPGRVVLDGAGAAHVVLRGSGKLLRIDLATATISAEASLCAQPRGLAYDASQDVVVAGCMDGQVVTLGALDYLELSRSFVARDLRDVVVGSSGRLYVSRYRSAELIAVGLDGSVRNTTRPKQAHATRFEFGSLNQTGDPESAEPPAPAGPRNVTFTPTLAWRALASKTGEVWMLHQQSQDDEIAISPGGYGSGCAPITQGAVTRFGSDGTPLSTLPIATLGLSVDVAVSADARFLAVASPGAYLQGRSTLQVYATATMVSEISADGCPGAMMLGGDRGQIVAVDFDATGLIYTFSREPAELEIFSLESTTSPGLSRVATIALDRRSVRDTGHELFHTDVGSGLSCASCHGEALDDGHVWNFRGIGARRTQNMRGGLLGTSPFHWDGDMASFQHLVDDVMTGRMGGFPVNHAYATALAQWIDKQPALRLPGSDAAAVERGRVLFESNETKCATCHSGDALTNNESADVGTGAVLQVPSLRGLGLRAPYMHNGCAKTLEERFVADCGGGDKHGKTSQLSKLQIADLSAYLGTL
jgi:mono/diheme cytochrome c family protein